MDKSSVSRPSLSRIDEESVWEKSFNSPSPPSGSSSGSDITSPEKTPEKARQKIRTLEEVLHNTQLDFDTLKEYTVLERQVLNFERIGDISQPDILASLVNSSLTMDRSQRSVTDEDPDFLEQQMNVSSMSNVPTELNNHCTDELMKTIEELTSENDKLKSLLEEKEAVLKETIESQSYCTETPAVAELQQQIKDLALRNKQYEESIECLMREKEAYEKMCANETGVNVVDLQNQIKTLQDENDSLKQDALSTNLRFKDYFETQQEDLRKFQENYATLFENSMNLQNQIETLQIEYEEAQARVKVLSVCEEQLKEQNLILTKLKNELQLPESENILVSLREYITDLHSGEKITELRNQIADLTKELEDLKSNATETALDSSKVTVNSADLSDVSGNDSEFVIKNLLKEIESHKSEIEGLNSRVFELFGQLEARDNKIGELEDEMNVKNSLVNAMTCKMTILSSYMTFLTKHLEKVTDNNNVMCLLVKDKSHELERLKNHLSGVKTKLRTFIDQTATDSDKLLDASNYFYDLFESDADGENSVDETEHEAQNLNQTIADALSTSKSFVDFSYCLNTLFTSVESAELTDDSQWLNNASNYFHQLFDSVSHDDTIVEKSEDNQSFSNVSNHFNNLFITPNTSIVNNQTLNDTSNYWYNLFDSFLNSSEIKPKVSENGVSNESVLDISNIFSNLFKSQNNSVNKSLNITAETSSILSSSNCLNALFKSRNDSVNKSLNISAAPNNSPASYCADETQSDLSGLTAGLQNLFTSNRESTGNMSFNQLNESQSVHPEIALCDGTFNDTTMFNGNNTCFGDPLKSFCADTTVLENPLSSSGFMSDSLSANESEFDLSLSPESFLRKIVNLKTLLNKFEDGLQDLSTRQINVSKVNDPLANCFNILMKSYTTAYGTLKGLVKAFDLDDFVLEGFEVSLRETSGQLNLTLQNESTDGEIHDLSANLNDQTQLIYCLENQLDLETSASKTLEDTIIQKESVLQDLRSSLQKSTDDISESDYVFVEDLERTDADGIFCLETELAGLKNELESKEHKVKELTRSLGELKVKNENLKATLESKESAQFEHLEQMRKKTQDLEAELSSKEASIKNLLEAIGDFNEDKEYFEAEMIKFMKQVDDLTLQLENKDLETDVFKEETKFMLEDMKEALKQSMYEVVIKEKMAQESRISELIEQLNALQDKKAQNELQLHLTSETQTKLENRIDELTSLLAELEEAKNESEETMETLTLKLTKVEEDLEEKQTLFEEFQTKWKLSEEEKARVESEMTLLLEEHDSLKKEFDNLVALKETLATVTEDSAAKDKRIEELLEELSDFEVEKRQNAELKELTEQADLKLTKAERELMEKQALVSELEEKSEGFKEDQKYYEDQMLELMPQVDDLKSQLVNLAKLTEENALKDKRIEELLKALSDFEQQNAQLKEQADLKLTESERELKKKEALVSECEEKLEGFETDKKYYEDQMIELMQQVDELKSQLENQNSALENFAALTEENAVKNECIEKLSKELSDVEIEKCQNAELKEQTERELEAKQALLTELAEKLESFEVDKKYFEDQLMALMQQVDTLKVKANMEVSSYGLDQTVSDEEKIVRDQQSSETGNKTDENSALEAKLREEEELIAQLKEKLTKIDEEKSSKETEVSVLLLKIDKFQEKVETQQNEIDRLSKLARDFEQQVQELSRTQNSNDLSLAEKISDDSEVERLLKEISVLSEQNASLKVETAVLSEEKSTLTKDFERQLAEKSEELSRILSEMQGNEEQFMKLSTHLEELGKCVDEKSMHVTEMEAQMAEMQAIVESKSAEIDSLKSELSKVLENPDSDTNEALIVNLSQKVAELEADVLTKSTEISKLWGELEQKSSEISSLEKQLSDSRESSDLAQKVADLEADVSAKTEEILKLSKDLEEKSSEISNLEKQLSVTREGDSSTNDLSQRLADLEAEVAAKTEEISQLSKELELKSSDVSELEKQLSDTREKLKELESADAELQKMKIELETSQDLVAVFEKKMDVFEEEKKEQLKKFTELSEMVDSKTLEIESLKREIATISKNGKDASKSESTQSGSDDSKEAQITKERLVKEIKSLKPDAQVDKIPLSGLVTEFMSTIMEKQKEIFVQVLTESDTLKTENKYLKSKEAEAKKWVTELESENTKLQAQIKEKDDQISSSDEKLSALNSELKTKTDLVESLQAQLDSRESEFAQLNAQLSALKNSTASQQDAEEIKLQTNEINKLNSECDLLRSKLQKEEDSVASLNKLIEGEIAKFTELNQECEQLKKELAEVSLKNEDLKTSLTCRDDEILHLKETLDRNVTSVEETNDLRNKYNEAINLKEALSADVVTLKHTVDEKTDLIKTLESQVQEVAGLKKDLEEKSDQLSSLSKTVDEKSSEIDRLNALLEKGTESETKSDQVSVSGENAKIIDSLNAEISALKETINRHRSDSDESQKIKSESTKLKLQVDKMNEDAKLLNTKLMIEKNRVTIMVSEIKVLEGEKTKLSESLSQVEKEKAKLMERLNGAKFENSASPSFTDGKKSSDNSPMFNRSVKFEKLNRQNAVLEKKVESLMEKEERLVQIEESLKSMLPAGSPSSTTALIGLLKQKLADADQTLAKVTKELSQKDSFISQQKAKFNGMTLAFEEQIDTLNRALDESKEKIANLTASLNESEEKRKTLDDECVMTWQQCQALEKDYAEALKRENDLKRKLFETTTASESCFLPESEVIKLKEEKNALTQENIELVTQVRSLKNEKRQIVSDFYKAKAKAKEAESELATLKSRVSALEKEKVDLDVKNTSLKKKLIEVTDEKENLSSSLNTLLVKYDALEMAKNSATDDQLANLKSQVQKLKTELVEKNAKITMLELQIQSENFPYRNKVIELETNITSYKKKCEDLRSQLRRYQASIQEATVQECAQCFARRSKGKSDAGVQTVANLHLDGDGSSIVQANSEALLKDRVKKLDREHETMKRLCRIRAAKITSLEQYIRQNNLPIPDSKENPEPAKPAPVTKTTDKDQSFTSRRVLTEANAQF